MIKSFLSQLHLIKDLDPECILTEPTDCWSYGFDNSRNHEKPDVVVIATQSYHIKKVVELCYQHDICIVARGRGTATTGAAVPLHKGVVLSLERLRDKIEIDVANRVAVVSPGVTNQELQDASERHGYFWPPDPTSAEFCTVGGNLALNSAGPRAVKYGTPRENVLGLKAITGTGKEIKTGVYTTKGVVGYDLTRLLIGSEGTLAIITEATLKLTPKPNAKKTLQALYTNIQQATEAICDIMTQPIIPYALEFIDGAAIDMIRHYSKIDIPNNIGAMLMIEVDGDKQCIDELVKSVSNAATNSGLLSLKTANSDAEVKQLWSLRKALSPALRTVAPKKINEDIVVPVSNIPILITQLELLGKKYNINIINFGHAGNGNIHINLLIDPKNAEQLTRAKDCLDEIFHLVLSLKGTLSGEHGIGIEKRAYIAREVDPNTLQLMQQIKTLFDPKGLLNPGKIFPASE